jgi:hypothetical protein
MFNCAKEILGYHDDEVTLPQRERDEMRERRDINRRRVRNGLAESNDPKPYEFATQGSYAMKTMIQHPTRDYDIDDGIYFNKADLMKADGSDRTPLEARQMVRDAVDDGSFKTKPEVRDKCVRIYYDAGYHVDLPVYRRVVSKDIVGNEQVHFELACGNEWKRSDAREVTGWFDRENQRQSPDVTNGRQMRRITRDLKKFARSRPTWQAQIASGFMITKLVTECYRPNVEREDRALYDTIKTMRDRLEFSLEVRHPVTPNETITSGPDDARALFLKERLSQALSWLSVLFETDCSRKQALGAWDLVFNSSYFSDKLEEEETAKSNVVPAYVSSSVISTPGRVVTPRAPFGEDAG